MENGEERHVQKTLLDEAGQKVEVKAYKRRWIILGMFMISESINAFQWIEYSIITHIVMKYYNVSSISVDWTAIMYMVVYPPLVIPASYVIDKMGLRAAGLIGCIGTCLGTLIKVLSIRRDLFFVVLIGQFLVASSQLFIVCLSPKIAAVWFKASEVSTACSLGVFGYMVGNAMGFIVPPSLVKNSDNPDEIGNGLKILCWVVSAAVLPVTIAMLVYFPREPPLPPTMAQANVRNTKEDIKLGTFFKSIGHLFRNWGFLTHMFAYGFSLGGYSTIATLLGQFVQAQFQGNDDLGGRLGFIMVICGMIGTILFGVILDKTHLFKEMSLMCCAGASISTFGFMYALAWQSEIMCYIVCGMMGVFTSAYLPVGFELAMELTYPTDEATTTGLMVAMSQIFGCLFTIALGYLSEYLGYFYSLATQAVILAIAAVITYFIPNVKRRQDAYKLQMAEDVVRKPSFHGSNLLYRQYNVT